MSYATANVFADPTPTTTLLTAIETLLSNHPAWSFIEQTVAGTYTCRIWKCSGAVNGTGTDFYLSLFRATATLATTDLYMQTGESYNIATHKFLRPCYNVTVVSADASVGAVEALPNFVSVATSTNTSSFTYWIIVTNFAVIYKTTLNSYPVFAGLYVPLIPLVNDYPLIFAAVGNNSYTAGYTSRRPGSENTSVSSAFSSNILSGLTTPYGTVNTQGCQFANGKVLGAKVRVSMYTGPGDGFSIRGTLRDALMFNKIAGIVVGDTITVGADVYVMLYDTYFFNTMAP